MSISIMGLKTINEKRINKIKRSLHLTELVSKSRLAHETGLHYFVVEDVLRYLKDQKIVEEIEGKWRLLK